MTEQEKADLEMDRWMDGHHRQDAGHAAHPGFENCEDPSHYEIDPDNSKQQRHEDQVAFEAFQQWRDEDR